MEVEQFYFQSCSAAEKLRKTLYIQNHRWGWDLLSSVNTSAAEQEDLRQERFSYFYQTEENKRVASLTSNPSNGYSVITIPLALYLCSLGFQVIVGGCSVWLSQSGDTRVERLVYLFQCFKGTSSLSHATDLCFLYST